MMTQNKGCPAWRLSEWLDLVAGGMREDLAAIEIGYDGRAHRTALSAVRDDAKKCACFGREVLRRLDRFAAKDDAPIIREINNVRAKQSAARKRAAAIEVENVSKMLF